MRTGLMQEMQWLLLLLELILVFQEDGSLDYEGGTASKIKHQKHQPIFISKGVLSSLGITLCTFL